MSNSVNGTPRVPQEASAEDVAQLIRAMDRTSLALSQMSVSISWDGSFVLNIPLGSYIVSAQPQQHGAATPQVAQPAPEDPATAAKAEPTTARRAGNPISLNIGPTPEEVYKRIENQDQSGQWFVVTCGTDVGVFKHLDEVSHLVAGVSGNAYERKKSLSLALEAYTRCWNAGGIRRV